MPLLTLLGVDDSPYSRAARSSAAIRSRRSRRSRWRTRRGVHIEGRVRRPLEPEQVDRILRAVSDSARRFELDPEMILAVIHVESRFDAHAVSSKGAMGLMQLLPTTAREVATSLEIEWTEFAPLLTRSLEGLGAAPLSGQGGGVGQGK